MTQDSESLPIRRRTFLRTGTGVLVPTAVAGCEHNEENTTTVQQPPENRVSGRVIDVKGKGVPDATVAAIGTVIKGLTDSASGSTYEVPKIFAIATTNKKGYFWFPQQPIEEHRETVRQRNNSPDVLVVAQHGPVGREKESTPTAPTWFGCNQYAHEKFFDTNRSHQVLMNNQVFLSAEASVGLHSTAASVWRTIGRDDHARQYITIEARSSLTGRVGNLRDGYLSLQVPESDADEEKMTICSPMPQPSNGGDEPFPLCEPQSKSHRPLWTNPMDPEETKWWRNPKMGSIWGPQTIEQEFREETGEPLVVPFRGLYGPQAVDWFTRAEQKQRQKRKKENKELAELTDAGIEVVLALGGELPSDIKRFFELLGVVKSGGKLVAKHIDIPSNPDNPYFIGEGEALDVDPNIYDTTKASWPGDPHAALHQTTLQIDSIYDSNPTEPPSSLTFVARGLWKVSPGGEKFRLEHQFTIDPTRISPARNTPPVAAIYGPETAQAGSSVTYDGRQSIDPDGSITHYKWTFRGPARPLDMGSPSEDIRSGSDLSVVEKKFTDPGIYDIWLEVTDDAGGTATTHHVVEVKPQTPTTGQFVVTSPNQEFTVQPFSGTKTIEEFYNHNANSEFSSNTPTNLKKSKTSRLFLYDGPKGLSLVMIHGPPMGEVVFEFKGIPDDVSWAVADDSVGGPTDSYEGTTSVSWSYGNGRTDGGALRDVSGADIMINPQFKGLNSWEFLSGNSSNPEVHELNTTSITIHTDGTVGD